MQLVWHRTPRPISAFGLKLQLYNAACGPNPLVQNWALSLLRPWAWASWHYTRPKTRWMSHYNICSSWFIAWELPEKVHLGREHDCSGTLYLNCPIPPWEVSLPNIPSGVGSQFQCHSHHILLPTKHPLSDNNIGPSLPLTTRVIITPHQLLGYKYEKRKKDNNNRKRGGKIIWKGSQIHWVSI